MDDDAPSNEFLTKRPEITSDEFIRGSIGRMMEGYSDIAILRAAVELDMFRYFSDAAGSDEFARDMGTDPLLTDFLCGAMVDIGLLVRDGKCFRNSPGSQLYLNPSSELYQGCNLDAVFSRAAKWDDLARIVKEGPEFVPREKMFGERWIRAIGESCMGGGVARVLDLIETKVDLSGYHTLLDLAGGHGFYAIGFALRHPDMEISLFDLPMMIPIASENFGRSGVDAKLIGGDFYADDLGGPYDVVFSSFNFSVCDTRLCQSVADSVADGGLLILRRHLRTTSEGSKKSLEWCFSTWDGKGEKHYGGSWLPTSEQYLKDMKSLGFTQVCREDMDESSELVILKK